MKLTATKSWEIHADDLNRIACDLITTAVEGGINYWAVVTRYKWQDPELDSTHTERKARVDLHPEDEPATRIYIVDETTMIDTIKRFVAGEFREFYNHGYTKTYRERLMDCLDELAQGVELLRCDYDFDADDADCMLQLACFGEVRYG